MIFYFRSVIVTSTVAYILWFFLVYADSWVHPEYLDLLAYNGYGSWVPNHPLIYWPNFGLWILAAAGLLFLQRWAVGLFVALLICHLALAPISGLVILLPLESFLHLILSLLDGVVLAMIFFSPIGEYFKKTKTPEGAPESIEG